MSYARALLFRWSRRDRLAVAVVAIAVAALVGTALLVVAAGTQTAAIAAEYSGSAEVTHHASVPAARAAAADGDVVLPVARVTGPSGDPTLAVGVPPDATATGEWSLRVVDADGFTRGTVDAAGTVSLGGERSTVTAAVHPRPADATVFPAEWYVTDAATVEEMGPSAAFVVHPVTGGAPSSSSPSGAPLVSALAFFTRGVDQALRVLGATAVGGAFLVAVTVHSVTRMSVRDRLETIRVARSTGAAPRTILGLFAGRATLLTAVGVALGYAVGVVLPNAAVSAAVTVGLPVALPLRVTREVALVVAPILGGLLAVGALAGAAGAWPAVRRSPARLGDESAAGGTGGRHPVSLPELDVVGWRALVPTAATLAAFVTFVLVLSSMAGVVAPMVAADADGGTITRPGSEHPVASRVPEGYATALQGRGIDASAEILLFEVVRGSPALARGADFAAFANVTDAHVARGRRPTATDEAAIGADLARTLGVGVGDRLTLGGSTAPAVARVEVVGTFTAPGSYDDQLVVSLPVARHLSNVDSADAVHLIRAESLPDADAPTGPAVTVTDVSAPSPLPRNRSVEMTLTLRNTAAERRTTGVTVGLADRTRRVNVTVPANDRRTRRVRLSTRGIALGDATLRAGDATRTVRVVRPDALSIEGLPDRAPPGSAPLVRVRTATDRSVPNAPVSVGDRTVTTDSDGRVRVPLGDAGAKRVRVETGERAANASVTVAEGATRRLVGTVRVDPTSPTVLVRPDARVGLYNPWNRTLRRSVAVTGPGTTTSRNVTLSPGERTTVEVELPRRSPGTHEVSARSAGRPLASASYEVTGDDRLASVVANSGRPGSSGIGRAVSVAFGNVWVVLATILGLSGALAVGGTTATFAQSIHARRRAVGVRLATGATRRQLLGTVVRDALVVGTAASAIAVGAGLALVTALDSLGYMTVFGVNLATAPRPAVLAATAAVSVALAVVGAVLTLLGLFRRPLTDLVADRPPARTGGRGGGGGEVGGDRRE